MNATDRSRLGIGDLISTTLLMTALGIFCTNGADCRTEAIKSARISNQMARTVIGQAIASEGK